jgi:7-cyano-7-deazaguanine synthase
MASTVLLSGGLDSAVLLADELTREESVWPIHVRAGLAWEDAETRAIARLLLEPPFAGRTRPLSTIDLDMRDVYPATHWAVAGHAPAYDRPDEDVYLEGRNIILVAKAAVLAARRNAPRIVLGPLAGNPFPDATPEFFGAMGRALSLGLAHPIDVVAPFRHMKKTDVIRLGLSLGVALEHTMSCMAPKGDQHCGACNKCRERREAFADARVNDPTLYVAG